MIFSSPRRSKKYQTFPTSALRMLITNMKLTMVLLIAEEHARTNGYASFAHNLHDINNLNGMTSLPIKK